jgi:hypothetical protein
MALVACGPSEEKRSVMAEQRRIDCLEKFCDGDVEPKRDVATEVALKLNGQWYVGPREYFSTGKNGGGFYWPSQHPMFKGGDYPEGRKDFPDKAIEVFLSTPKTNLPGKSLYQTLLEMEAKGQVLEKATLRPGLQVWRTREHGRALETWYVASSLEGLSGDPPTIACREINLKLARCSTGFRWLPDVAASMRLSAIHAPDWPEIYLETQRVLKLLRRE